MQRGHCPGNQGNQEKSGGGVKRTKIVSEKSENLKKNRRKSGKSQGIETDCPNVKLLLFLSFSLIISSSTKMVHKKVREKSRKMKVEKVALLF